MERKPKQMMPYTEEAVDQLLIDFPHLPDVTWNDRYKTHEIVPDGIESPTEKIMISLANSFMGGLLLQVVLLKDEEIDALVRAINTLKIVRRR